MRRICKFLLKLLGWKAMDGRVEEDKAIILGVPHTSAWDFLISYLFYTSVGGKAYIMIKKEFFVGPLSPLLKALGGIPVDRKKGATITLQMIHAMNNAGNALLSSTLQFRIRMCCSCRKKRSGRNRPSAHTLPF